MKTLTTATILLSLSVSGTAFAANPFDGISGAELYAHQQSQPTVSNTLGSQPEIGSVQSIGLESLDNGTFWNNHGEMLDRTTNPDK